MAESLLSVVHRVAGNYQVPITKVVSLATSVQGGTRVRLQSYKSVDAWLGYKSTVASLLSGFEVLGADPRLRRAALFELGKVVGHGRGFLADRLRICPACVCPQQGVGYGPVCHQLKAVNICPIHCVALNEWCVACGSGFAISQSIFPGAKCRKCRAPLAKQCRSPAELVEYDQWCERETLELVRHMSSPSTPPLSPDWAKLYTNALRNLSGSTPGTYSPAEAKFKSERLRYALKRPGSLPSYSTLLQLAAIQAVSLVALVESPVECCSPRLAALSERMGRSPRRSAQMKAKWTKARSYVCEYLASDEKTVLPSKAVLLGDMGLLVSGFWQRYPDLALAYEAERVRRRKLHRERTKLTAREAAENFVLAAFERGGSVQVRRDGAAIQSISGASKQIAEDALRAAVATFALQKKNVI